MSSTLFAPPAGSRFIPKTRTELLALILDPRRLPTPPAVALQIVNEAGRPDCTPEEIVRLLSLDAALSAKLLRAVNSVVYGLKQPVASVARAVQLLGLKPTRSLALSLSLPAVKPPRSADQDTRDYWISSVSGGIIARELAVLTRRPDPAGDLVAGLLRDMGLVLLQHEFLPSWEDHLAHHAHRLLSDPCGAEIESFGIDHADVSAELLRTWNLPDELVEAIRHHHRPDLAEGKPWQARAELLHFTSQLVQLDHVAQRPDLFEQLLETAQKEYNLSPSELGELLQKIAPKVEEFAIILNQTIGQCPNYAAILATGNSELVKLTIESQRRS